MCPSRGPYYACGTIPPFFGYFRAFPILLTPFRFFYAAVWPPRLGFPSPPGLHMLDVFFPNLIPCLIYVIARKLTFFGAVLWRHYKTEPTDVRGRKKRLVLPNLRVTFALPSVHPFLRAYVGFLLPPSWPSFFYGSEAPAVPHPPLVLPRMFFAQAMILPSVLP